LALAALGTGVCRGAGSAPPEVLESAAEATKALAAQVMEGNYAYSIEKMYPRWKARAAKREGGMKELLERLAKAPAEMQRKGITLLDLEVGQPAAGHEVRAALIGDAGGGQRRILTEWLVLVPTTSRFKVVDPRRGVKKEIETYGYQVAIANKERMEWTFIDGSGLSVSELRRFFPGLPEDREALGMPRVGGRELK